MKAREKAGPGGEFGPMGDFRRGIGCRAIVVAVGTAMEKRCGG